MQGIDLRYLELIDTGYILGKKKRLALNGIIYEADLYFEGKFYHALVYRYWLGGGKLLKASFKGKDILTPIFKKIEEFYDKDGNKGPDGEYILRELTKILVSLCMLICIGSLLYNGYLYIIGRYYGAENIHAPVTLKKTIMSLVILPILYFIRLKVFSFRINKAKERDPNE